MNFKYPEGLTGRWTADLFSYDMNPDGVRIISYSKYGKVMKPIHHMRHLPVRPRSQTTGQTAVPMLNFQKKSITLSAGFYSKAIVK